MSYVTYSIITEMPLEWRSQESALNISAARGTRISAPMVSRMGAIRGKPLQEPTGRDFGASESHLLQPISDRLYQQEGLSREQLGAIEATPTCLKELCIKTVKARELLTSLSGSPSATFRFMWHPRFSGQTSTTFRADIHDFRIQYGGRDNLYRNHECSSSGGRCEGGLSEIDLNTNPDVLGFEEAQDDPVAEH
jgi:hypothetical protein